MERRSPLGADEQACYQVLRRGEHAERIRLNQIRIHFPAVEQAVREAYRGSPGEAGTTS